MTHKPPPPPKKKNAEWFYGFNGQYEQSWFNLFNNNYTFKILNVCNLMWISFRWHSLNLSSKLRYSYIHTDVVGFQGLLPGLWKINAHKILLNDLTTVICSVKLSNFLTPSKFDHLIRILNREFMTGELLLKKSQRRKFLKIQGPVLKISLLELKTSTTTLWANQPHIGGKANLSGFFVTHAGICLQYISYLQVQAVMNSTPRYFFPSFKDLTTYMGMLTPGATELFGGGLIPP